MLNVLCVEVGNSIMLFVSIIIVDGKAMLPDWISKWGELNNWMDKIIVAIPFQLQGYKFGNKKVRHLEITSVAIEEGRLRK